MTTPDTTPAFPAQAGTAKALFKTVSYAYPTSSRAKELGRHSQGCFYVKTGQQPDSDLDKGPVTGPFESRDMAVAHALTVPLPWSSLFLKAETLR